MSVRSIFYVGELFAEVQSCVESVRETNGAVGMDSNNAFCQSKAGSLGFTWQGRIYDDA